MKQSQTLFLTFLLAILLVAAYILGVFNVAPAPVQMPKWSLNVNDVRRIEITEPQKPTLQISKADGLWQIDTPQVAPADQEVVDRFLSQLAKMKPSTLVTDDPKRFAQFGIDTTARILNLTMKDKTHRLVLGSATPDSKAFYLRMNDSNQVVRMEGVPNLSSAVIDWRSLSIVNINPNDIQKIVVESPEESYTLSFVKGTWQVALKDGKTFPADSSAVARWLGRFENFRGESYVKQVAPEMILSDKTHRVTIQTLDNKIHELMFRKRTEDVMGTKIGEKEVFQFSLAQLNLNIPTANELAEGVVPDQGSEDPLNTPFIIPAAPVPVSKPTVKTPIVPEKQSTVKPTSKPVERKTTTTTPRVNVPRVNLPVRPAPVARPSSALPQSQNTQNTTGTTSRNRTPVTPNTRQWQVKPSTKSQNTPTTSVRPRTQ